jgi:hypothetical protein
MEEIITFLEDEELPSSERLKSYAKLSQLLKDEITLKRDYLHTLKPLLPRFLDQFFKDVRVETSDEPKDVREL